MIKKRLTKEHRRKISEALRGKPSGMLGKVAWNKGIKGSVKPNRTSFAKGGNPWNKGKKTGLVPKSAFKKGVSVSPKTQFKKGHCFGLGQKRPNITGEKNSNWKGGITSKSEKIRKSTGYVLWRKACFERDDFTCQKTGQRGGRLVVHHISNFADFEELRTSIDNGITLSVKSHKEFHRRYGNKNNTREQLLEFLKQ